MSSILLSLIEKLVLSPVNQQAAWDIVKPYIMGGQVPPVHVVELAHAEADAALSLVKTA